MKSSDSINLFWNHWIWLFSHVVFGLEYVVMESLRDTVGRNECEPEVIVIVGSLMKGNIEKRFVKGLQMRFDLPLV